MRIGIYDPYLDTLGGGERYILTAASCLSKKHQVEVFWDDKSILDEADKKLNIDLSTVKITKNIFNSSTPFYKRTWKMKKYDRILFFSDGSIPWLFAKKNILLFQFPVNWVNGRKLLSRAKLKKISKVICYTYFVKHHLDKVFSIDSDVLYPPVISNPSNDNKKENIILTVGRFTKGMNMKKQEVLIEVFKQMQKNGLKNWKFVLIGSYLSADEDFVGQLKKKSEGYPIEIITNASFEELSGYYQKAKIYWHAAGFGEDLKKHPERAEHFGISTVEAMSAGAVPIVINAGGQIEIVTNKKDGFLWDNIEELQKKTKMLIDNPTQWSEISKQAIKRAKDFGREKFCDDLDKLLI